MLVLGVLALVFPFMASVWVTTVVAVAFLVGGIVGWINNLMRAKQLSRWLTFWRLVVSTVFVVAGVSMIQQLGAGPAGVVLPVASLSLAIGIVFLVEGCGLGGVPCPPGDQWLGLGTPQRPDHPDPGRSDPQPASRQLVERARHFGGHQLSVQRHRPAELQRQFSPRRLNAQPSAWPFSAAGPWSAAEQSSKGINQIEPVSWWSSILNSIPGSRPMRLV